MLGRCPREPWVAELGGRSLARLPSSIPEVTATSANAAGRLRADLAYCHSVTGTKGVAGSVARPPGENLYAFTS